MNHTMPSETVQTPVPQAPTPKPNRLRTGVKYLGFALFGFLLLALLIPIFFEKQIGEKLIAALNEELATEVIVENFELSLFSGFPKVAASLEGVVFKDAREGELLKAKEVSFHLGLFSLFSSEAKVETVWIAEGELYLEVDEKGKGNYSIIKAREESSSSDFAIAIEEAILKDIHVNYVDLRGPHNIDFLVEEAQVAGKFSAQQFDLSINAESTCNAIDLDSHQYLVDKSVDLDGIIHIDLEDRIYAFKETTLDIEGNPLRLGGSLQSKDEQTIFDLQFLTKNGSLKTLIGFLPDQYTRHIADLKSEGSFNMVARIKGPLATNVRPSIDVRFGLEEGKIKSQKYRQSIRGVSFKGSFSNGDKNSNSTSLLAIDNFKGNFHGQQVSMNFKLKNIDRPKITLGLDGKMPMADLEGLLNLPNVTDGEGHLALKDIKINGRLKDLIDPRSAHKVDMSGRLVFQGLAFKINDKPVEFNDGRLLVSGNKISLDKLQFKAADSEMAFSGKCYNLLPMIFADAKGRKAIKVRFVAGLESPKMDIKALANLFSNPESTTDKVDNAADGSGQFLTNILAGTFKANVAQFQYGEIKGQDFKGYFEIDNNELAIDGEAKGMEGQWVLDGTVFLDEKPHADARLSCMGINLNTFFKQTNNFGQKVLRAEHLQGRLLANLKIDAFWNEAGDFLLDDLHVLGDVAVSNGELKDFELLYDFSKFIKMKDLEHVRFTTMRHWLEVKDRKIHIPSLFVQSNALNLELCGTHTFENRIDYNVRVNAGQVIFNKFKKYNPKMLPVKAQKEGVVNLNYRINGTVERYKVKMDTKRVKQRLNSSLVKKRRIKNRLTVEFGELDIPESNWANMDYLPKERQQQSAEIIPRKKEEDIMASADEQVSDSKAIDDLGPSADSQEDQGFRLDDLINKDKGDTKPKWDDTDESDEDEFMDFEIEGKKPVKPKKPGGGKG